MRTLNVFFAYAFSPREAYYTQQEITQVLGLTCEKANVNSNGLIFKPDFLFSAYGNSLLEEIETRIRHSGVVVVDISNNNPNALYEMGFARALSLPIILTKAKASQSEYQVPSDLRGLFICYYEHANDLLEPISNRLLQIGNEPLHISHNALELARMVWDFSRHISHIPINIIAADSATKSEFRLITSHDHIYLDNLCDKDSLMELLMIFGRLYPQSQIRCFNVLDYPRAILNEHLVLVGGSGTATDENNTVAREFCRQLKVEISYDEHSMIYDGVRYNCEFDRQGHLCLDQCFFGRFRNPWNKSCRVFFVQGVHTLGVLGAAKTFSLQQNALDNNAVVSSALLQSQAFATRFSTTILHGEPCVPQLKQTDILVR